jgi:hypothetical protein
LISIPFVAPTSSITPSATPSATLSATPPPNDSVALYKQATVKFSNVASYDETAGLNLLLELEKHVSVLGVDKISELWMSYLRVGLGFIEDSLSSQEMIGWVLAMVAKSTLPETEKKYISDLMVQVASLT